MEFDMHGGAMRYGIRVGVDASSEADAAVAVKEMDTAWDRENADKVIEKARQILGGDETSDQHVDVQAVVHCWGVVPTLIDASKDARMTVVGSRGMGAIQRLVMGSVSSGLIRHARGPVMVIHADDGRQGDSTLPVVVGIDGSHVSEAAVTLALEEAANRGVGLVAVHAWRCIGAEAELLEDRLAKWRDRYPGIEVRQRLGGATPARWLVEESRHAQLIVVGSHAGGGFAGMTLGSVSSAVAQTVGIPVTVVWPR